MNLYSLSISVVLILFSGGGGLLLLASADICPSQYPCAATYPINPANNSIEVGVLVSVDVNEPWALAMRAYIEIVIDEINEDPNTLPNNQLVAVWGALGGLSEAGGIFSVLNTGLKDGNVFNITKRVPLLLGPLWSSVAKPAAIVAAHLDLAMLGATCSSPELSNNELYPTLSRVYPADDAAGVIFAKFLHGLGIRKVAVIARNDAWGSGISAAFIQAASDLGMDLLAVTQFDEKVSDGEPQLRIIKNSLARIIVTFMYNANEFLAAANRIGMIGPQYQYFAGDGFLSFPFQPATSIHAQSIMVLVASVDRTSAGYLNMKTKFDAKRAANPANTYNSKFSDMSLFFMYFYDCILFGAKAIHELVQSGHDMATVSQAQVTAQLRNQTLDTGVSGTVKLDSIGDRIGFYEILNYKQVSPGTFDWVKVGGFGDQGFIPKSGVDILWSTGSSTPPRDSVLIRNVFEEPRLGAVAALWTFAGLGILACLATLAFNMHFRELRYIKMSSPLINNVILIGCLLAYCSVFLLGIHLSALSDIGVSLVCHSKMMTLMFSFTLAFGGLFAKTWRVFRIFVNKNMKTVTISHRQLFGVVAMMVFVDLLISVIWASVEPMKRHREMKPSYSDPNDADVNIVPIVDSCSSPHMGIFTGLIIAYKSLIIMGGAVLAVLTQKVNIKALNDSRQIGLCIYTVGLVTCIVVPLLLFVQNQVTVSFVFAGFALWFNTSAVIAILFGQKIYVVVTGGHEEQTKTNPVVSTASVVTRTGGARSVPGTAI